jgi:K+/H+ antiporter YhaU regulatory subunit KhtT
VVAIKKNDEKRYNYSPSKNCLLSSKDDIVIYGKIDNIFNFKKEI